MRIDRELLKRLASDTLESRLPLHRPKSDSRFIYRHPVRATVKRFEEIDHTADVAIRAYGHTANELFANTAEGLFSLIVNLDTVEPKGEARVQVTGDDLKNALFRFLSELLFVHETQHVVFRDFEVAVDGFAVDAVAHGEQIDPKRHELQLNVKAVTYNNMELDIEKGQATVVFDI